MDRHAATDGLRRSSGVKIQLFDLPAELLDAILAECNTIDLFSFIRVSHLARRIANPILYRDPVVSGAGLSKFVGQLECDSSLCGVVRSLDLTFPSDVAGQEANERLCELLLDSSFAALRSIDARLQPGLVPLHHARRLIVRARSLPRLRSLRLNFRGQYFLQPTTCPVIEATSDTVFPFVRHAMIDAGMRAFPQTLSHVCTVFPNVSELVLVDFDLPNGIGVDFSAFESMKCLRRLTLDQSAWDEAYFAALGRHLPPGIRDFAILVQCTAGNPLGATADELPSVPIFSLTRLTLPDTNDLFHDSLAVALTSDFYPRLMYLRFEYDAVISEPLSPSLSQSLRTAGFCTDSVEIGEKFELENNDGSWTSFEVRTETWVRQT